MFEKEAEEYRIKAFANGKDYESIATHWKKGAEFGYNKANEWHYVKDGELPNKTGQYLVYIINGYGSKFIKLIQYNSGRHFWCVDCQNDVIAWKEIVLPELKGSE